MPRKLMVQLIWGYIGYRTAFIEKRINHPCNTYIYDYLGELYLANGHGKECRHCHGKPDDQLV